MSNFRAKPNEMLAQSEQLDAACRELCQDMAEIGGVIRRLGNMRGFENQIKALQLVQRRGSEQQIKLRQSARVLETAAEIYASTERKNLDGYDAGQWAMPVTVKSTYTSAWRPQEMLPNAGSLLGMKVIVRK